MRFIINTNIIRSEHVWRSIRFHQSLKMQSNFLDIVRHISTVLYLYSTTVKSNTQYVTEALTVLSDEEAAFTGEDLWSAHLFDPVPILIDSKGLLQVETVDVPWDSFQHPLVSPTEHRTSQL